MARQRDLLVNIERMRREMAEFLGDTWAAARPSSRSGSGFSPRVDVYLCEGTLDDETEQVPIAVVTVDLAGVAADAVNIEVSGRTLVVSGRRPVRETAGRAYQQVEIPTGGFRRAVDLGVDVEAERARATYEEGLLRVRLPIRIPDRTARKVPIERSEGEPG